MDNEKKSLEVNYAKELEKDFPNAMSNVYCGVALPKGWYDLVREVMPLLELSGCKIAQIKEKFGGLRLYFDGPEEMDRDTYNNIYEKVRAIESRSFKVCEQCSNPGIRRGEGWVVTLCDPCHEERKERDKREAAEYRARAAARKAAQQQVGLSDAASGAKGSETEK
jgi:hypothetical protein